jgi:glycosyltransferase involved in cell wall biosynthesis
MNPPQTPLGPDAVMMVTRSWGRDGGVGAHVQAAAAALAESGVEVHVLAARIDSHESFPGVTVCHLPRLHERRATPRERLGAYDSAQPLAVHFHQLEDPGFVSHLRRSAPVLISAHGYPGCTSGVYFFEPGHECTRAHGPGCVPNLVARGCAHTRYPRTLPRKYLMVSRGLASFRRADLAISYSAAVDRHLAANGLRRRAVIPFFPTMPASEAAAAAHERRVLVAGRVDNTKGVGVLIEAVSRLDAELVVCGDGRQEAALRTLAERLGVAERVRFAGWLAPEQLAREIAATAIVAMPSLWPEPFGLVGLEAMAAARPVVASATGGILDWLEDGVTGIAVPPGDTPALAAALGALLDDPGRRREMGEAGRELVARRYTKRHHVEGLRAAYAGARERWQRERGA